MSVLSLRVTSAVLQHVSGGSIDQRQIAIKALSDDLDAPLATISKSNRRTLTIGGCLEFTLGDRGALWRSHNQAALEDFDLLFDLLARRPHRELRVLCELN